MSTETALRRLTPDLDVTMESEMQAQQVAEALLLQAATEGLRMRVTVVGTTVIARLAGGACFAVTVEPWTDDDGRQ